MNMNYKLLTLHSVENLNCYAGTGYLVDPATTPTSGFRPTVYFSFTMAFGFDKTYETLFCIDLNFKRILSSSYKSANVKSFRFAIFMIIIYSN